MTKMDRKISAEATAPAAAETASAVEDGKEAAEAAESEGIKSQEELEERAREARRAQREARREAEEATGLANLLHFGNGALGEFPFGAALRHKIQLPGETVQGYEAMRAAFVRDFNPETSAEITILESLARVEWELVRHRLLRELELYEG
ncbi:hypothetical protein HKCCSP123_13910, partial [Rhodobacterales bacterium HKCCSP123]|nr:hypothetical protein [Rhodobacterales bacterium HKCCSP123]